MAFNTLGVDCCGVLQNIISRLFSIIAILIFFLSCVTEPQGCGTGNVIINGKCYNNADLDVLQGFIDNSSG